MHKQQVSPETLLMPDQDFNTPFVDENAPGLDRRYIPRTMRRMLLGVPLLFSFSIAAMLVTAFHHDGQLTAVEVILIVLMTLLAGWEAIPSANAIIGFSSAKKVPPCETKNKLNVAILATIRDECARDVIAGKLNLLQSLQQSLRHSFDLHVLSDSSTPTHVADEKRLVAAAFPVPIYYHHRTLNVDFKSGNIRNWISKYGASYDAFIVLDADSELDFKTATRLADELAADPACGLIQTVPVVRLGHTRWQGLQSFGSRIYGELQGQGFAAWMGDTANYYGHNAIIRTKAFATCAGLPHITGRGLWNGCILSHDFVEAALLRRAGWAVKLLPGSSGSFEQAPTDMIAHLKRDARWCLGNFQHSRILWSAGLDAVSRFHLLSGIFTYVSSAVWLVTLFLWVLHDGARTDINGVLAAAMFVLIAANIMLPRLVGVLYATRNQPSLKWAIVRAAILEMILSSMIAPSLMLQRVRIIGSVFANQKLHWPPLEKTSRSLVDYFSFHALEVLLGLGLLAAVEHAFLTYWFTPIAICLVFTPLLSWRAGQGLPAVAHENLNDITSL